MSIVAFRVFNPGGSHQTIYINALDVASVEECGGFGTSRESTAVVTMRDGTRHEVTDHPRNAGKLIERIAARTHADCKRCYDAVGSDICTQPEQHQR
jgi:hypothetical protein